MYWDIKSNLNIESGFSHCHTMYDALLDATGDLAIISGTEELQQRFFHYLATPKGERFNPNIGSSCHDYLHEKNTRNNLRRLEQDILGDMSYQFPDINVSSVTCIKDIADPFQMKLDVRLADSDTLQFLYTPEELVSLTNELTNLANSNY